jgi:hypothetical protein
MQESGMLVDAPCKKLRCVLVLASGFIILSHFRQRHGQPLEDE